MLKNYIKIERANTPVPLVQTLKNELPEVEKATHLSRKNSARIEIGDQTITVEDLYWTDQDFFDIFSVSTVRGNKSEYLKNPDSIVITESVANTHFRNEDPLGKTIQIGSILYTITGVIDDWPVNSHIHPQFIATFNTLRASDEDSWLFFYSRTYFLLDENASITSLTEKLPSILESKFGKEANEAGMTFTYTPQALTDIHLYSNLEGELEQNGSIRTIQIILAIVLLILLNACLNYINLSTARARKRAKEVLKGDAGINTKSSFSWGRRSMMVFQFLICISLMVSSLVILKQMRFIQQKDLGFEESNLVVIPLGNGEERNGFDPLKDKLLANSNIEGVTSAVNYPGRGNIENTQHWLPGETVGEYAEMGFVSPDFVDVFEMNIKEGRDFTKNNQQSVILNETAVQRFGLGENPIGKQITRTDPGLMTGRCMKWWV